MATVCPTVTAYTEEDYRTQIEKIVHLGHRIQIDLTDGIFTKEKTLSPEKAWWPVGLKADFHLMYKHPMSAVKAVLNHKPHLVIVHAEAEGKFMEIADLCHHHGVGVGLALLPATPAEKILPVLSELQHVLIFSGNLGYQGGSRVDFNLLGKAKVIKNLQPEIEIGWDGGINDQNISRLAFGGVDVFNVGGFLQKAADPERAYQSLQRIAEETGTT